MHTPDLTTEREIAALLQRQMSAKEISVADYDRGIAELVGIDGADAADFLKEYSSLFHVDMSNFIHHKYFGNEGFDIGEIILNFIWKKYFYAPLSITQLAEFARREKWPAETGDERILRHARIVWLVNNVILISIAALMVMLIWHAI